MILFTFLENWAERVQHRWQSVPVSVGTEWEKQNKAGGSGSGPPGANISSGHTQSPLPWACSSETLVEPEGWYYFGHRALFNECTW